jgi:hypothetical protein
MAGRGKGRGRGKRADDVGTEEATATKSTPKGKLVQLARAFEVASSRIGAERGALGDLVKKAEADSYLDRKAFAIVMALKKLDDAKASRIRRNIELYCDLLEVGMQTDLEDAIEEAGEREETDEQAGADVLQESESDPVTQVAREQEAGEQKLREFEGAIREDGIGKDQVQRALENFVADNPHLAAPAERIVAERLRLQ